MNEIIKQWDKAAERYAKSQNNSEYANSNKTVVKDCFQKLDGEKVLDLGCGFGYYTDFFNSIGAKAIGIDGAEKMIQIAREQYPHCEFQVMDIMKSISFETASFDIIFCNQVFMDIESIEGILAECNRLLKEGGILYYSIVHPAFYNGEWIVDNQGYRKSKEISSYLTSQNLQNYFWGETSHFHRPISYYLNKTADAGFIIKHIEEPKSYDGIKTNAELPLFFMVECIKQQ